MARGKYCKMCGLYDDAAESTDKKCATCAMPVSRKLAPIVLTLVGKSRFFCCKKCVKIFLAH